LFGQLRERGSELIESVSEGLQSGREVRSSALLDTLREKSSELAGRRPESGLLLLRKLYMLAPEASINWVKGAQAARDHELLQATKRCHPNTLPT
jgi:hypothetical protein